MMNCSRGVLRTIFSSIGQPHALAFIDYLNKHTGSCDALSFYCERSIFIYILITKRGNSTCINCLASGFCITAVVLHKLDRSIQREKQEKRREEKRREEKRREEKRREEKRREEKRREEKRREEETDIHFRLFIMTDINCQWQECPHKSGILSLKTWNKLRALTISSIRSKSLLSHRNTQITISPFRGEV